MVQNYLQFANDTDALAEKEHELERETFKENLHRFKAEKTKLMENSINGIISEIKVEEQR